MSTKWRYMREWRYSST